MAELKEQLCIRGAGGWKDTDDLRLGGKFKKDIVQAIEQDTGGFIWWATRDTLDSEVICETELPTALARAERDPHYPVVPVFVELRPRDRAEIATAVGADLTERLLDYTGVTRASKQSLSALAREAGRLYAKQLVNSLPPGPVEVAISCFRAPTGHHDLTLDWRTLFDPGTRARAPGAIETITEALGDLREALQGREQAPRVNIEIVLPLPLAMLVGFEWRTTSQLQVTVKTVNPDSSILTVAPGAADTCTPETRAVELGGTGPHVLAVSVGATLGQTVERYAAAHDARGFEHLHVELANGDLLDAGKVRALAALVVDRLNKLQAAGTPKHLLLRGPANLAVAIGLGANGTGRTWVPFYDGHEGYVGGVTVG